MPSTCVSTREERVWAAIRPAKRTTSCFHENRRQRLSGQAGFLGKCAEDDEEADVNAHNGADIKALHQIHAHGQPRQNRLRPVLFDGFGGERGQGEKNHRGRHIPGSQPPAGRGKEMHVQAGRDSPNPANCRIEPELAEEEPGAETDKKQRGRGVNFQEQNRGGNSAERGQNGGKKSRNSGGGAGSRLPNPVDVAPGSKEPAGELIAFRDHRAQRAVIGKKNLVGQETLVKEKRQGRAEHPREQEQVMGRAAVWFSGDGWAVHVNSGQDAE